MAHDAAESAETMKREVLQEEAVCALCLDVPTGPCAGPCGHSFCRECILQALRVRPPRYAGSCPLCRQQVSVYTLKDVGSGSVLATPQVTDLYGTVFTQSLGLGVASYHFDSEEFCYISYEEVSAPCRGRRRAAASWRLDDGSPVPARRPFTDATWDRASRTYRATVRWDPPFQGNSLWEYEILFAEDFSAIVGGRVRVDGGLQGIPFKAPWDPDHAHGFSLCYVRWAPPPGTLFGQVFVQGFHYASTLEGVASYHFEAADNCYLSYANAPPQWILDDGSAPPARKSFIDTAFDAESRTFQGLVEWEVPFNGASRWRYTMIFAEDYGSIVGGTWESFTQDGRPLLSLEFRDPAEGEWLSNTLVYVAKPPALTSEPTLHPPPA